MLFFRFTKSIAPKGRSYKDNKIPQVAAAPFSAAAAITSLYFDADAAPMAAASPMWRFRNANSRV
jgi:hypothetical protein